MLNVKVVFADFEEQQTSRELLSAANNVSIQGRTDGAVRAAEYALLDLTTHYNLI